MSIFLSIAPTDWVADNDLAFAIRDGYPVNAGHTLVIPKCVVASWFEASEAERAALLALVDQVKAALDRELKPDGYNLGINDGAAAGQTVPHLHIHVIPRWNDDVDDPRGGVRYVIPERGNYTEPGRLPLPTRDPGPWRGSISDRSSGSTRHLVTGGSVTGGLNDPFITHLRLALRRATSVHIVAAFVQDSGVDYLAAAIDQALARRVQFQILTGDYLHITQAQALRRLLDWSQIALSDTNDSDEGIGSFEVRVIETAQLGGRSFHPKSWRLEGPGLSVAWVGSSNWSRSALTEGVEWNLRVDRGRQSAAYGEVVDAFATLWRIARPLDAAWLATYVERAAVGVAMPLAEIDDCGPTQPAEPRGIQLQALEALARTRREGRSRALVVLATGLGKTFLAAFDVRNFAAERGQEPRVLFVAHRRELLVQAAGTFRKVFPDQSMGLFVGNSNQLDAQFVFASVQKLTGPDQLARLDPNAFDYVVVDESHHASAKSYRQILAHLTPSFLLGLTATPERADDADVAGRFDDHVAFRADLAEGIERGQLVPFHYVGVLDTIAYQPIRSEYTVDELESLAATEARMAKLWEAWQQYPGQRTLVFCVSIRHADYVASWLTDHGVAAVAVHTGADSADREEAIERLSSGTVQAVVVVDLYNEGLDVPLVDRVVMLRPTKSPVVFLQQLGRGLRIADDKPFLQVIDFVGNHKIFLLRMHTLLSLAPNPPSLRTFVQDQHTLVLPHGCTADFELGVIELLAKLLPAGSSNETIRIYRELRESRGTRPTPGELVRRRLNPASVQKDFGHWFGFVAEEGDLSQSEQDALKHDDWLREVERTKMNKSFKMVALEVLLQRDALYTGMPTGQIAAESHEFLLRNPELLTDLDDVEALPDPRAPDPDAWRRYWERNPIAAWTGGSRPWFVVDGGVLRLRMTAPLAVETQAAMLELTRQLVDWRLSSYRRRRATSSSGQASFNCKVIPSSGNPILKLPDIDRSALPSGETDVRLDDGALWSFRFKEIAINVARPIGEQHNALHDLLRGWFGPNAGRPGTDFHVRFSATPDGWSVSPLGQVLAFVPKHRLVTYPTLMAAAGSVGDGALEPEEATVRLPVEPTTNRFAVRVAGHSMDGGRAPLRDGDWAVFEWARKLPRDAVLDRVVMVSRGDLDEGPSYHIKRLVRDGDGFSLRSDNRAEPDLACDEHTVVLARLVAGFRPEQLAPIEGSVITDWTEAFGIDEVPRLGASRVDGHLFLLIDEPGLLIAPDRVAVAVADRGVAETAYVLTRTGEHWRYVGVGRWGDGQWRVPNSGVSTT